METEEELLRKVVLTCKREVGGVRRIGKVEVMIDGRMKSVNGCRKNRGS